MPPGIKRVRVDPTTGLRRDAGSRRVLEAFKPDEEPDDQFSVIGYTNDTGGFAPQPDQEGQPPRGAPRGDDARALTTRRGLW